MSSKRLVALTVLPALALVTHPSRPAQAAPPGTVYDVVVRVLPQERRLEASGTIRLAAADTVRAAIPLTLGAPMSALRVELVEPAVPAKLELEAADEDTSRVAGERKVGLWILRPARPIPPGQAVELRFSCEGGSGPGLLYHVGPEVAFASGWGDYWYPVPRGAGQGAGELTVTVPAGWKVATGAVRRSDEGEEARGTFRATYTHPTYFTFVAGPYTVTRRVSDGVPLTAWLLEPRDRVGSWLAESDTLFRVLADEFGPYPFDELGFVEVPRPIAQAAGFNGFSPPGLLVLNHRAFNVPHVDRLYEWMGHEMGHQWFPHAFSLETPPGLFTEEALAEYGGLRAVELIAGAGRDLDWFYEQWFERTGAPDFALAWRQEGGTVRGTISQTAPHYRATLKVEIRGRGGERLEHAVPITGAKVDFAVPAGFSAESVVLDPGYEVLRWTPEYRAAAAAQAPAGAGKP